MKLSIPSLIFVLVLWFVCCSTDSNNSTDSMDEEDLNALGVIVENVTVSGEEMEYSFKVTLKSPDTGCEQYADWWEVIDTDGNLLYRRILAHSHVNEQPFTRSGAPVQVSSDQTVFVRGHMNNLGYGENVFKGSVENGFTAEELDVSFAQDLEEQNPLPQGCGF